LYQFLLVRCAIDQVEDAMTPPPSGLVSAAPRPGHDDPRGAGLAQQAAQGHLLVQVVADLQVLRGGLDGGLVDHPSPCSACTSPVQIRPPGLATGRNR
jgi:hypothetical protein